MENKILEKIESLNKKVQALDYNLEILDSKAKEFDFTFFELVFRAKIKLQYMFYIHLG